MRPGPIAIALVFVACVTAFVAGAAGSQRDDQRDQAKTGSRRGDGNAGHAQETRTDLIGTTAADAEPRERDAGGETRATPRVVARTVRAGGSELLVEVIDVADDERVEMLHRWARESATTSVLPSGRFALRRAAVRIREIDSRSRSPVPWGQTLRRDGVAVLLFVRRGASYEELRGDWTAVHEFAHLYHPYLGARGRWLAEGLASYYQNVLRARAGLLAPEDAWLRLDAGFRRGEAVGPGSRIDALGRGGTMRVYWAGAAFWLDADLRLRREHGTDLLQVLDAYAQCCLDGEASLQPEAFMAALDRTADVDVFSKLYARYAPMRDFPSLDASYAALGIAREGDGLGFADDTRMATLRSAIMGTRPDAHVQRGSLEKSAE
jgi:hypothetical protein